MNTVELGEVLGGELQAKFNKSLNRVIENLLDPNTSFKQKRKINISLVFEQNEERDDVTADIDVTEKLAPQTGLRTHFAIGKDLKTGEVVAEEYGKQVRGQFKFNDVAPAVGVGEIPVDQSTGEVIENKNNSVVDFRKVAER